MSETIFRIQKNADNPFVMIDKRIFTDKKLSYRAKGVLGYLLSRPDNWLVNMVDVANQSTEGRDAVLTAVNELMKHGYVERIEHRENGRFKSYEYLVYEVPKSVVPSDDTAHWKSVNGKSVNGLSVSGKSATTNKDITKKEYKEKEKAQPQNSDGFIVGDIPQQPVQEVTEKMIDEAISYLVMQKLLNPFELFNREAIRFELINSQQYKKPAKITLANFIKSLPVNDRIARFQNLAQSEVTHPSHIVSAPAIDDAPKLSREEKLARIAQIERGEI